MSDSVLKVAMTLDASGFTASLRRIADAIDAVDSAPRAVSAVAVQKAVEPAAPAAKIETPAAPAEDAPLSYDLVKSTVVNLAKTNKAKLIEIFGKHKIGNAVELKDDQAKLKALFADLKAAA